MPLLEVLQRELGDVPRERLYQEAVAEALSPFGSVEAARQWLKEGGLVVETPRGLTLTRTDVAQAIRWAQALQKRGIPIYTYIPMPIPFELLPAAAGAIHSAALSMFWKVLREEYGIDWRDVLREAWEAQRMRGGPMDRRSVMSLAWAKVMQKVPLTEVAKKAWAYVLGKVPVEEEEVPSGEVIRTTEGVFPLAYTLNPTQTEWMYVAFDTLLKTILKLLPRTDLFREPFLYAEDFKGERVWTWPKNSFPLFYRGRAYVCPRELWARLRGFSWKIGGNKQWLVIHYGRGWAMLPGFKKFELKDHVPQINLEDVVEVVIKAKSVREVRDLATKLAERLATEAIKRGAGPSAPVSPEVDTFLRDVYAVLQSKPEVLPSGILGETTLAVRPLGYGWCVAELASPKRYVLGFLLSWPSGGRIIIPDVDVPRIRAKYGDRLFAVVEIREDKEITPLVVAGLGVVKGFPEVAAAMRTFLQQRAETTFQGQISKEALSEWVGQIKPEFMEAFERDYEYIRGLFSVTKGPMPVAEMVDKVVRYLKDVKKEKELLKVSARTVPARRRSGCVLVVPMYIRIN